MKQPTVACLAFVFHSVRNVRPRVTTARGDAWTNERSFEMSQSEDRELCRFGEPIGLRAFQ